MDNEQNNEIVTTESPHSRSHQPL